MSFVTTNIRLEAEVYRRLKLQSAHTRRSLSHLIREAVDRVYQPARTRRSFRSHRPRDPLLRLVGICRTGIRDGSVEHDRDIYGPASPRLRSGRRSEAPSAKEDGPARR